MVDILVHIPYWKKKEWFQAVVDGWLNQTHKDFKLLVSNDGDDDNPKDWLEADGRVSFFDLKENRGRYFADQVALQSSPYKYYCVSDADDIPSSDRLEKLLTLDAPIRLGHQQVVNRKGNVSVEVPKTVFRDTAHMKYIGHFAGLYDTEVLRSVGGFHPGFRVGYDSLVTSLLKLAGYKFGVFPGVLHTRYIRPNSLISSPETAWLSPYREEQRELLTRLYRRCWSNPKNIRNIIEGDVSPNLKWQIEVESLRLKKQEGWV